MKQSKEFQEESIPREKSPTENLQVASLLAVYWQRWQVRDRAVPQVFSHTEKQNPPWVSGKNTEQAPSDREAVMKSWQLQSPSAVFLLEVYFCSL